MVNEHIPSPPALPVYAPPKERQPATLPEGMKPHGILSKFIGKVLKAPKMKASFKMMSTKKNPQPVSKPKKKKVL